MQNWLKSVELGAIAAAAIISLTVFTSGTSQGMVAFLTIALLLNWLSRQNLATQINSNQKRLLQEEVIFDNSPPEILPENPVNNILPNQILPDNNWGEINNRFTLIEEAISELATQISHEEIGNNPDNNQEEMWQDSSGKIRENISSSKAEDGGQNQQDWESLNVRFLLIEESIVKLGIEINDLHKENREIIKPYLKRLVKAVKKLQHNDKV